MPVNSSCSNRKRFTIFYILRQAGKRELLHLRFLHMSLSDSQSPSSTSHGQVNLSFTVSSAHRQLIIWELFLVFLGSLLVTSFRFQQNFIESFFEYPGAPKVFLYPLLWYYFLSQSRGWDRSTIHFSNDFYIAVIRAGWKSLIGFAALAYLAKYPISRVWVITNAIVITALLLFFRFLLRRIYFRNPSNLSEVRFLYIGSKDAQEETMEEFKSIYGFMPMIYSMNPPEVHESDTWLKNYLIRIFENQIYGVVVAVGAIQDAALLRQLSDTRREQVVEFLLATRIGSITQRFESLEAPTLVRIHESSIVAGTSVIKRIFDMVFSFLALVSLLPLLSLIALCVKLTSKGPIFYIDQRVGKDGKLFTFPKFRSMYVGADSQRLSVLGRPDESMSERYKNDPRITPFGRFIRRWSIDELPQFWCVLLGTMSVVGPRPILQEELVQIPNAFQIRFIAKPGLTGLWQVTGRKEVMWNERMIRDISYIDNWSLSGDLILILKTLTAIIKGEGAH